MIYVVVAFIAGMLTKIADNYSELKHKFLPQSILIGMLYGAAIAYAALLNPALYPIIIGIVVGNVFAGKVDAIEHVIAVIIIMGIASYFVHSGVMIDFSALAVFSISAFADEALPSFIKNDFANMRLTTPIIAIAYIIIGGWKNSTYAIFIIAFDAGYKIIDKISKDL